MKISFTSFSFTEGKVKYNDKRLLALNEKHKPPKFSPYYVELIPDDFAQADAIIIPRASILDLLILDIDKLENRKEKAESDAELKTINKALELLESETPLCDGDFDEAETAVLEMLAPHSFKPVYAFDEQSADNDLIGAAIEKAGMMFFYTAGPKEVHAWIAAKGAPIIDCAGKIHSDLARGFIKGEIVHFDDYMACHSFNEARSKGLVQLVDRDHPVEPGDVIEIRFNV